MSYPSPAALYDEELRFPQKRLPETQAERREWQFQPSVKLDSTDDSNITFRHQTSDKAQRLQADIKRVARFPFNILITGETGTGKTLAARQIHERSARAGKPFMELNCSSLPEQLVEAELFGYRKGAFTGADREHKGLFEEASGGILFLDEIGDMPLAVQNKLLKAIEEKQIKRLGTNSYVHCDVQIIAATSRILSEMIRRGEFREDLYCRLAVLTFETAPLRERREDIPALIDYYLREAGRVVAHISSQSVPYRIEQGAVERLCEFDYPGNIRVLRNLMYELTSYVSETETITVELVIAALNKIRERAMQTALPVAISHERMIMPPGSYANADDNLALQVALRSMADEGDIILPLEVCLLRQGETFKQWTARAKRCSIEAAREAAGGTMRSAAARLGVTRSSLKGHLHRAKAMHTEASL